MTSLLRGSLLAALVPGSVLAKGGNSACAKFCAQVFGANTPAASKCTSDAAKGKGLCYTYGPPRLPITRRCVARPVAPPVWQMPQPPVAAVLV